MPLVIDGAKVASILRSPEGPIGRHLMERATVFQAAARQQVAPHRKTGCLEGSMVKRFEVSDTGGLQVRVISDTSPCNPDGKSYSLYVHEGTTPHVILPVNSDVLSFYWANGPDGPGQYFFKSVNHPGTAPIPFFKDNLHLFI